MLTAPVSPCLGQDHVIHIQVSIGTASRPKDGMTAGSLLEAADKQLHAAKNDATRADDVLSSQPQNLSSRAG